MKYYFIVILLFGAFIAEAAPQKIIYLTIPKSGTHMLRKAMEMITNQETRWIPLSETASFNPIRDLKIFTSITSAHLFPEYDIIRTHFGDSYLKVLLIRDPRDIMVSFSHHLLRKMTWFSCPQFDYHRFEKLSFDNRLTETLLFPIAYSNPSICFETAALWMKDPTIFVCRFEDLVGEAGGGSRERQQKVLEDLAAFLKVDMTPEKLEWIGENLFGGSWTFREGKIGAWKESYNEYNKQLFKQLMGQSVIDLGYEKDGNW